MISDAYFPRVNGVSTSIATFRRELGAQGHEVHLIAPDYGAVTEDEHNIHRIHSHYLFLDPEDRLIRIGCVLAMRGWLRQAGFDIVHIQTPFAAHYLGVRLARELGRHYAGTWSAGALATRLARFYRGVIERHVEVPAAGAIRREADVTG